VPVGGDASTYERRSGCAVSRAVGRRVGFVLQMSSAARLRPASLLSVLLALTTRVAGAASVPCPAAAALTVVADNRSDASSVSLSVSGTRVASSGACEASGTGFATAYVATLTCAGSGLVTCGRIEGLAPGAWVHRLGVQVAGSVPQSQARRSVLLAQPGTGVSNVVDWTVYGRTFVVDAAVDTTLLATLDAASAYTATTGGSALVRFDPAVFPGASTPTTIDVKYAPSGMGPPCAADAICSDGRHTAHCLEGSRIAVDALDQDGLPGGVVLRVGTCSRSLLRVYGDDDVLRGLVLEGSENPTPVIPLDTIVFGGGGRRSRLERCVVHGPTMGDAVTVLDQAGQPAGNAPAEIVVADSQIMGAEDKGLKVDFGGVARIERSCVHDNVNGGVQSTLGGAVTAIENVVQHNVGGPSENGILVGVPNPGSAPNALATRGNVVRFNGARGISVVNTGVATLASDVASDNYQAGIRVESVVTGEQPRASVRGGTFACNFAPGVCPDGRGCRTDDDCGGMSCGTTPLANLAKGAGAALAQCLTPGCLVPLADFGSSGDGGRNAFTRNANPAVTSGANLNVALAEAVTVLASGNQWEHCDVPSVDPNDPTRCFVDQVAALDVRPVGSDVDLGAPGSPRHGPAPVLAGVSPGRPRAGDLVRVYGDGFDAIDGSACAPPGLPADACSAESATSVAQNAASPDGTRVTVSIGSPAVAFDAEVHAVTPTMVLFKMPIDCFAAASLVVRRGGVASESIALCDAGGCVGRDVGTRCDDRDDVCTSGEACTADGACSGALLDCDDGNPCTVDACAPNVGCTHVARPEGASCGTADACSGPPTCRANVCTPGTVASCDDDDACTDDTCDPVAGCRNAARTGMDGIGCRFAQMRLLVGEIPAGNGHVPTKLRARILCGEQRTKRADASPRPGPRRRQARRALACVARYDALVGHARRLDPVLQAELRREGDRARSAIATTFGLP
jgi:hypothetical protein